VGVVSESDINNENNHHSDNSSNVVPNNNDINAEDQPVGFWGVLKSFFYSFNPM